MKAAMIMTGTGPILILTSFDSIEHPGLAEKLETRGINRFIAYEVPVEKVKKMYGMRFSVISGDLSQTDARTPFGATSPRSPTGVRTNGGGLQVYVAVS